jgi:hypothetical protein
MDEETEGGGRRNWSFVDELLDDLYILDEEEGV